MTWSVTNPRTLAERLMLFEPEDADLVVEKLQQGVDLKKLLETLRSPVSTSSWRNWIRSVESSATAIRPEKDPSGPPPPLQMPAWEKQLSGAQIDSIIAYLLKQQTWEDTGEEEGE